MPPDESKLARLLPGIAARGAETQESVRKNAHKEAVAALPSAYVAEKKGRVAWWSTCCLVLSLLMGGVAFALSCIPQTVPLSVPTLNGLTAENFAGSPLRFWIEVPSIVRPSDSKVLLGAFFVNAFVWMAAALSVWGACHWMIVRWYSRRWKFSLADMLAITAAASCMLGAWRMDYAFTQSENARHFLQTVSEDAQHKPVYQGPLVVPISQVSTPALLFFCLAGASAGINMFHIVDRYALQMRQFK
jgi:hypothetical protein